MAEEEPPAPAEAEPADAPKDDGVEEAKAEDAGPTVAEPATKNMSCFHFPDFIFMLAWFVSLFIMGYIAYAYGYYEVKEKFDEYEEKLDAYESGTSTSVPSDAIVVVDGFRGQVAAPWRRLDDRGLGVRGGVPATAWFARGV